MISLLCCAALLFTFLIVDHEISCCELRCAVLRCAVLCCALLPIQPVVPRVPNQMIFSKHNHSDF